MQKLILDDIEIIIYKLFSEGFSIKEIAKKLNFSKRSISLKMKNVSQKINTNNKIETMCKLIRANII